ncbi:hypothetical protein M8J75_002062 [Diaphorina citri]|nr:hypothetical protein M8J75_002062 [Diaphorina citri]
MYACDVCGKVYQHKQTLDRHKKDEYGFPTDSLFLPSPFGFAYGAHACDNCGKLYSNKANVRRHKRDECGGQQPRHQYSFTRGAVFLPSLCNVYLCNVCGKAYQHRTTLRRHQKFECGQEPRQQCPQCPYRTRQKATLNRHVRIRHCLF